MYAIVSCGGRQHRVSAGDRLVVDRIDATVGDVVDLAPVLMTAGDDGDVALGEAAAGVRVTASVVRHLRGEKLRIFKYKPKKRARRTRGHRSELTELRVEGIEGAREAAPAKPAARRRRPATQRQAVDSAAPAGGEASDGA